jgi:hypothetical protein
MVEFFIIVILHLLEKIDDFIKFIKKSIYN